METLVYVSLIVGSLALLFSVVSLVVVLSWKLSTHKVEYVTREGQQAVRQAVGLPAEPGIDHEQQKRVEQQLKELFGEIDGLNS